MARPKTLQFLEHGKILCGSAFRFFVETWNYIVRRTDNLRGDKDENDSEGCIFVDNSNPERPVIRLDRSKIRSSPVVGTTYPSVYDIAPRSESDDSCHFINRFYEVSGIVREGPDNSGDLRSHTNAFVAIRITNSSIGIYYYQSLSAMQADMLDQTKVVMPLYKLDGNGDVSIDLRHLPRADMWSLGLPSS